MNKIDKTVEAVHTHTHTHTHTIQSKRQKRGELK